MIKLFLKSISVMLISIISYYALVTNYPDMHIPVFARSIYYYPYSVFYNVNHNEMLHYLDHYESFSEFFHRKIDLNFRHIDSSTIVSPCDGILKDQGIIYKSKDNQKNINLTKEFDQHLSIKGFKYTIKNLIGFNLNTNNQYYYNNIYLAPGDYHRIHAPCDLKINRVYYIKSSNFNSYNYPLNEYLDYIFMLQTLSGNERVVVECDVNGRMLYIVMVAAMNVGNIIVDNESILSSDLKERNKTFKKGDEIGYFTMGSSVVMILEQQENQQFIFKKKAGQIVKLGNGIYNDFI